MGAQNMKAENQQGENADKNYFCKASTGSLTKGGRAIKYLHILTIYEF
ncbi:MAG: hypothetical protein JO235_02355 [Chroococcidiopsidaceae cyanobacterium CP_BM_RX_35]|nr:hypothetical protein [Chroococcidiopsidaceae cyanobacterium CP_BM_RX_35]